MAHWLDDVVLLLTSDTDDLRKLAALVGADPKTFYLGIPRERLDLIGQDVGDMQFGWSPEVAPNLDQSDDDFETIREELSNAPPGERKNLKVRVDFIANTAHVLRTLLTTMLGMPVLMYRHAPTSTSHASFLRAIDAASSRAFSHVASLMKLIPIGYSEVRATEGDLSRRKYFASEVVKKKLIFVETSPEVLQSLSPSPDLRARAMQELAKRQEMIVIENQALTISSLIGLERKVRSAVQQFLPRLREKINAGQFIGPQLEYAEGIYFSSNELLLLTADLSVMARLEASRPDLGWENIELASYFEKIASDMEYIFRGRPGYIRIEYSQNCPARMFIRQEIASLIFRNILSYVAEEIGPEVVRISCDFNSTTTPLSLRIAIKAGAEGADFATDLKEIRSFNLGFESDLRLVAISELIRGLGGSVQLSEFVHQTIFIAVPASMSAGNFPYYD